MNLSSSKREWIRALVLLSRDTANLIAIGIFWLIMIGLIACPVWLPPLVEYLVDR